MVKKKLSLHSKKTAKFAFSSVVSTKNILKGEKFNDKNIWVKRPGLVILRLMILNF